MELRPVMPGFARDVSRTSLISAYLREEKARDEAQVNESRPREELAVNQVPNQMLELHMAGKRIRTLVGFEEFKNLNVLWLNNNELKTMHGLGSNYRLEHLYLHDNKLTRLDESLLSSLRFLKTLSLYNNQLVDVAAVVSALQPLRELTYLNLFGNPCAEEQQYRQYVIHCLPQLQILDRHVITADERARVAAFFEGTSATIVAFGRRTLPPAQQTRAPFELSEVEQRLEAEARQSMRALMSTARGRRLLAGTGVAERRPEEDLSLLATLELPGQRYDGVYSQLDSSAEMCAPLPRHIDFLAKTRAARAGRPGLVDLARDEVYGRRATTREAADDAGLKPAKTTKLLETKRPFVYQTFRYSLQEAGKRRGKVVHRATIQREEVQF